MTPREFSVAERAALDAGWWVRLRLHNGHTHLATVVGPVTADAFGAETVLVVYARPRPGHPVPERVEVWAVPGQIHRDEVGARLRERARAALIDRMDDDMPQAC